MRIAAFFLLLAGIARAQDVRLSRWVFASGSAIAVYQTSTMQCIAGLPGEGSSRGGNTAVTWAFLPVSNPPGSVDAVLDPKVRIPGDYSLEQNFPNPFNPKTVVRYQVPEVSNVKLEVYDLLGRVVATLVNEVKRQGTHEVDFDGSSLASGVYFYRLQIRTAGRETSGTSAGHAGTYTAVRKMILMK